MEEANRPSIPGTPLLTRAQSPRGGMVDTLMGKVEDKKNPNNGAIMNRRKDVVRTEPMIDMLWFEPGATEIAPVEYYVPADATRALDLLSAHGIRMRQAQQPTGGVERFAIDSNMSYQSFEGHNMRRLEGKWY